MESLISLAIFLFISYQFVVLYKRERKSLDNRINKNWLDTQELKCWQILSPPLRKAVFCEFGFKVSRIEDQIDLEEDIKKFLRREFSDDLSGLHFRVVFEEWGNRFYILKIEAPKEETIEYKGYPLRGIPDTLWEASFPDQSNYPGLSSEFSEGLKLKQSNLKKLQLVIDLYIDGKKNHNVLLEIPLIKQDVKFKYFEKFSNFPQYYHFEHSEPGMGLGLDLYDYCIYEGSLNQLVAIGTGSGHAIINISHGYEHFYVPLKEEVLGSLKDLENFESKSILIRANPNGSFDWIRPKKYRRSE